MSLKPWPLAVFPKLPLRWELSVLLLTPLIARLQPQSSEAGFSGKETWLSTRFTNGPGDIYHLSSQPWVSFEKRLCPNPELHWCCGSTVGPAAIRVVSLGDSGQQSRTTLGHSLHLGCTCKLRSRLPVLDSGPSGDLLPVQPQAIHFTSPGFCPFPQLYQRSHNVTSLLWLFWGLRANCVKYLAHGKHSVDF